MINLVWWIPADKWNGGGIRLLVGWEWGGEYKKNLWRGKFSNLEITRESFVDITDTNRKRHRYKEQILQSVGEGRLGWFERIALKHVYYHMWNRWQVQVQCMKQSTHSWCTGTTLRDGMGRDVGGWFNMGDTCTAMADSCQRMAKTTTIL